MIKERTVYLCGPMENATHSEMCGWRDIAKEYLHRANVATLDPVRRRHSNKQKEMRRIFELDLLDIRECDFVLVNLNNDALPKHGTAMEVFYAAYVLNKPVIAFKESITRYHPFFESLVTEWRSTVEKACETIIEEYII